MENMTVMPEIASELNKLKKPELINLIIYKKLPDNFRSDVLSDFLGLSVVSGGSDAVATNLEERDKKSDNPAGASCPNVSCVLATVREDFCRREIGFKDQIIKHQGDRILD